ncbi:hypothetical protein AK812_SmicGene26920, partial [Symbiodinium microadriaticum]
MPISAMLELCRGQPGFVAWVKKTAIESNEAAWLENQKPENKEKEVLKLVGANPREPTPEPKIDEMQEMKKKEPEKHRKQAKDPMLRYNRLRDIKIVNLLEGAMASGNASLPDLSPTPVYAESSPGSMTDSTNLEENVTMEAIARTLQMQLQQERHVLTGEIHRAMSQVNSRVDDVEKVLGDKISDAVGMLQDLAVTQRQQGDKLETVATETQTLANRIVDLEARLQALEGESNDDARRRAMKAVQRVRAANVILGRREDSQRSRLWLAISQSPAKRKRAQLAAKTKRLILELGGAASRLDVEYSTGTAWYNGGRVCSGTAPKQGEDAVEAGAGWIDLAKIARNLGMSEDHVKHAWEPLATALRWETLGIATWNVGGLSLPLGDTKESSAKWQLLGHRQEEEWRGVGIAYDINVFKHSAPWHRANAYKAKLTTGDFTFVGMSVHVPHHATIDQTNELLSECYDGIHTGDKLIVGMDANEEFKQRQVGTVARTARGEVILLATSGVGGKFPPQDMDKPTHFPYNTVLRPRRLTTSSPTRSSWRRSRWGKREMSSGPTTNPSWPRSQGGKTTIRRQRCTWGVKQLKTTPHAVEKMNALLDKQEDHHRALAAAAEAITEQKKGEKFVESRALKDTRRLARQAPPGEVRRQLWKTICRQRREEHKDGWQDDAQDHFRTIFGKIDRAAEMADWVELRVTMQGWKWGKATGVDGIAHEAFDSISQLHMGKLIADKVGGASFLDDTYLWSHNRDWLVKALTILEEKLGKKNLFLNAKKTHAMANAVDKTPLHIGGKEVQIQEGDAVMQVLGSPVSFDNVPAVILGGASERARKAFHANKSILCSKTSVDEKLRGMLMLVRPAALWACATWPINESLLKGINTLQLQLLRKAIGGQRRPGEEWVEWNK